MYLLADLSAGPYRVWVILATVGKVVHAQKRHQTLVASLLSENVESRADGSEFFSLDMLTRQTMLEPGPVAIDSIIGPRRISSKTSEKT